MIEILMAAITGLPFQVMFAFIFRHAWKSTHLARFGVPTACGKWEPNIKIALNGSIYSINDPYSALFVSFQAERGFLRT